MNRAIIFIGSLVFVLYGGANLMCPYEYQRFHERLIGADRWSTPAPRPHKRLLLTNRLFGLMALCLGLLGLCAAVLPHGLGPFFSEHVQPATAEAPAQSKGLLLRLFFAFLGVAFILRPRWLVEMLRSNFPNRRFNESPPARSLAIARVIGIFFFLYGLWLVARLRVW